MPLELAVWRIDRELRAIVASNQARVGHADLRADSNDKAQRAGLAITCRSRLRRRQ